ncbi:MAG: aminotransferase [Pseudomonadota bacterium]
MTNLSAQALADMDRAHALHPWTHFDSFRRDGPMVISRGEGCYLWDADGRRYLDAVGGLWCTNIGLGRREMAQAIAEQAEKLAFSNTFVDLTNDPAAMLAARLAELAPSGLSRVHFTTGGSTAIDSAYRLAQYAQSAMGRPDKTHVIARRRSYHGSTYVSMSIGLRDGDRVPEFVYKTDDIHHISAPFIRRPADEAAETARLVAEFEAKIAEVGADRIAAFFAEPIQASGGVIVPPEGYLKAMREVCRAHDILFVADEVVTGFGRLGHWFASEGYFGIDPDIVCVAKGLSSGYQPIGAVLFSDDLWQAMAGADRWFTNGFTYAGHPVACAAALKNIEIMEREGILANARTVGAYFQSRLEQLNSLPIVGETRGAALIACVENVADKSTMRMLPDEIDIGKRISDAAEARGLMVRPMGHQNVMSPPLVITEEQVDFTVDTLALAIGEVTDALVRDGVRLG